MNKDKLQQELLAKIKPGTKPSDLKRPKRPIPQSQVKDEGYESDQSDQSIPKAPLLPNQQIQALQSQITSLKKQLQTYKDFKEADLKIKKRYKQEIKNLQEQNNSLNKTIQGLKNQNKTTKETEKPFLLKNYSCQICFTNRKAGIPSQFLRVKGLGGE